MGYLDSILEVANNGPSPEDKEMINRLANIAGSTNYKPPTASATDNTGRRVMSFNDPGVTVPPPSATAQELSGIRQQQADLVNQPAHGARRIWGDIAGVASGILSKDPQKGIATAEAIKSEPYTKAYNDLANKAAPLENTLTEEQKRTQEAGQNYRVATTANYDAGRLGLEQQLRDTQAQKQQELNTKDAAMQKLIADRDAENKKHKDALEKAASDALTMKKELEEAKEKYGKTIEGQREIAAQKRAETMAAGKNLVPDYDQNAADALVNDVRKLQNPDARRDAIDESNLDPKSKQVAETALRTQGIELGNKATATEKQQAVMAKQSLSIIGDVKDALKKVNTTGPISGRIEKGKLIFGDVTIPVQQLSTALKMLPMTETATLSKMGAAKGLYNIMMSGTGDIKMTKPDLLAALGEMEKILNRRTRSDSVVEKTKYTFSASDVTDVPKK